MHCTNTSASGTFTQILDLLLLIVLAIRSIDTFQQFCSGQTKILTDNVISQLSSFFPSFSLSDRIYDTQKFRSGQTKIVVATDVAARGLDIPSVEIVVHYRLPKDTESFVHRYASVRYLYIYTAYVMRHFTVD